MKRFKHILKPIFILSILIALTPSIYAKSKGIIVVSSDVNISTLSKSELERIFLGKTTIWDDGKRIQIGLSVHNTKKANHFFKNYIGKNQRRYKKYWLKLVFAGYGIAPKIFKSDKKAINYTKNKEGVITFVSADNLENIEDLKIVNIDGNLFF